MSEVIEDCWSERPPGAVSSRGRRSAGGMLVRGVKDIPMNIGLIGCGSVVETLHLPALVGVPDLTIKWVCDSSVERARTLARNWNVKQAFARIEDCGDVDAVLIATPVGTRREILDKTISRGWHALCEKPFALDANEHCEILESAARNGIKMSAGFMRRYYWAVEESRTMVRSKVLGPLREIVASESAQLDRTGLELSSYRNNTQASGGGVLLETGCHLLDEVMFATDAESADVRECTQTIWNDYEVETIASGYLALRSGEEVALHFAVSGIRPIYQGITFRCEFGELRLKLDPAKGLELLLGQAQPYRLEVPHPRPAQHQQHVRGAFRREWIHFLEGIRGNHEWDPARETGLLTSDVIMQCTELAKVLCSGGQK
jgi:predicted dehydrogenase